MGMWGPLEQGPNRVPGFDRGILNPWITGEAPQKPLFKEPRLQENPSVNLNVSRAGSTLMYLHAT